jgi:hypothetical protein
LKRGILKFTEKIYENLRMHCGYEKTADAAHDERILKILRAYIMKQLRLFLKNIILIRVRKISLIAN